MKLVGALLMVRTGWDRLSPGTSSLLVPRGWFWCSCALEKGPSPLTPPALLAPWICRGHKDLSALSFYSSAVRKAGDKKYYSFTSTLPFLGQGF